MDHLTTARTLQAYTNVHRAEDSQPFDDVALFLPYPSEWKLQNMHRQLNISKATAIAVISSLSWLDSNVIAALDEYMDELEMIARGD